MNCIGPTARSHTVSPSQRPLSESGIAATPGAPFSGNPTISGEETPFEPTTAPPKRPWSDSTRPIPASNSQSRLQDGSRRASVAAASRYALSAAAGMP